MRLYHGSTSPDALRQCRESAPSHTHGYGWGPAKMTPHDTPYFIDNGAYSEAFDKHDWLEVLDRAVRQMPRMPDFVVYPDVFGDAESTRERVREIFRHWTRGEMRTLSRFVRYLALQPGLPIESQVKFAANVGASGVFVGGPDHWKRTFGSQIVDAANERGLRTHVGSPPGELEGLMWAYDAGFDSADTTTIVHNENWDWLERLESATDETRAVGPPSAQSTLTEAATVTDGGRYE